MSKNQQKTAAAQGFIILIWEVGESKKGFHISFLYHENLVPKT